MGKRFPNDVTPELATLVSGPPDGDDWVFEIKLDGYRALAFLQRNKARLVSRNGKEWTDAMRSVADALEKLDVDNAILDGEVVVYGENGVTSFQALQNSLGDPQGKNLNFCVFDLLYLDGRDLRDEPLLVRKRELEKLFKGLGKRHVLRYSAHLEGDAKEIFQSACRLGAEGIIAKRRDSTYQSKRTKDWLKIKCSMRQEVVIGGFTEPSGAREGVGALLVGVREPELGLRYAGKVGTGFTRASLVELEKKLGPLARKTSPFVDLTKTSKGVHWVEPKLVGEVMFTEWTSDGRMRHPSFQGLRSDKKPKEVTRERATTPPKLELHGIEISNPNKLLYEEAKITKRQVVEYYASVAPLMLEHVCERPLMLQRCPNGKKSCFYQKHASAGMDESIHRVPIVEGGEEKDSLYIKAERGIVAMAQMGTLEVHTWGARVDRIERPDLIVFDLDPAEGLPWPRVVEAAIKLRLRLKELELESFLKTTGGKGLHIVVPIARKQPWENVRAFSEMIANELVRQEPKRYIAMMTKAQRVGKVFIDYFRNNRGSTFVAPYSTRSNAWAGVAMPIEWSELEHLSSAAAFTLENAQAHLQSRKRDPWAKMFNVKQSLRTSA